MRKLLRAVRNERRALARRRPVVGTRRALAERVREHLELFEGTLTPVQLESSIRLLTDEIVGDQECLARLEVRITDLTRAADREVARIQRLEDLHAATTDQLVATADPLREAALAGKILATSTWIEQLAPSDALVSIVMPTHNRPALLREAIDSVLQQSHRNFELLVVDDASGPETAALLRAIDDPRVRAFRREANGGGAAGRNIGLERVRGEYVAYLDDDNLIGRNWLRGLIWAFENDPACDIVYGAMSTDLVRSEDGMPIFALHPWDRQLLLLNNIVDQSQIAHRAGFRGRYDEVVPQASDWDFVVRATADRDARPVPVVAVHYRTRHAGRISDDARMAGYISATQQRFTRRGPIRVLVLGDEATADGASPVAAGKALEALGDHVTWSADARLGAVGSAAVRRGAVEEAIRAARPDVVLVSTDPEVEAELQRLFTAYVAFGTDGTGERPSDERTVSLGRWDGRTPFGVADDGPALRTALLRHLDVMHATWSGRPAVEPLSGDVVLPVTDTRDEPGLVTVLRDATVAPPRSRG